MHDPMILAFSIGRQINIWHVDPETDGTDDSCGWSSPRAGKRLDKLMAVAKDERDYFFRKYPHINLDSASCQEVIYAVWQTIAWQIYRRRQISPAELVCIASLASNPFDNLRGLVREAKHSEYEWERLWICTHRAYARFHRRWYQHPRWHFHHWKIQVMPWLRFKRWAFERCGACKGRFTWGYSPVRRYADGKGFPCHHECKL